MKQWRALGVALAVLWLFVRGIELAPARILGEFLIGLAVGLPVAFVFRRFYGDTIDPRGVISALPYVALYLLAFLKEMLVANVDVVYRVLAPSMPIEPAVVEVPLRVESDAAVTTIANSITLTPGTLTMDYDQDSNTLYVHAIDGSDRESVLAPINTWQEYALKIFDERPETDRDGAERGPAERDAAERDAADPNSAERDRSTTGDGGVTDGG